MLRCEMQWRYLRIVPVAGVVIAAYVDGAAIAPVVPALAEIDSAAIVATTPVFIDGEYVALDHPIMARIERLARQQAGQ
jgi:hypothetical protein